MRNGGVNCGKEKGEGEGGGVVGWGGERGWGAGH